MNHTGRRRETTLSGLSLTIPQETWFLLILRGTLGNVWSDARVNAIYLNENTKGPRSIVKIPDRYWTLEVCSFPNTIGMLLEPQKNTRLPKKNTTGDIPH